MIVVRLGFLASAVLTLLGVLASPAPAASVVTQTPCSGTCATFAVDAGGTPTAIPTIATFSFDVPANTTATVLFNGTGFCTAFDIGPGYGVIDLVAQITTGTQAPTQDGPGGARHVMAHLVKQGRTLEQNTWPLNLAATRVVAYRTAGRKTVYFKIARLRMDRLTDGAITNTGFTVILTP
ncbi:MAG: hypothetical protein U1E45_05770 [Geminicoccaceae bacterium]